MFRRPTSTARSARPAAPSAGPADDGDAVGPDHGELVAGRATDRAAAHRHSRRIRQQESVDEALLRARLERVDRRLAEVGSVHVTARAHAIDNDAARRDPLTRPFASPVPATPRHTPPHRPANAPLPRPA